MSTEAQIEANRSNSLLSTGPTTDEGKDQSRLNSTTHGLTGTVITAKVRINETYQMTLAELMAEIVPMGAIRVGYVEQAALALIQSQMCMHAIDKEIAKQRELATNLWSESQRIEAQKLLATISRSPRKIAPLLRESMGGCLLLREEWQMLWDSSVDFGPWNDAMVAYAFDLLGIPKPLRQTTKVRPKNNEDAALHQQALAAAEIARLDHMIEHSMVAVDEFERDIRSEGPGCFNTPTIARYLRYMHAASARYHRYVSLATGEKAEPISRSKPKKTTAPPPVEEDIEIVTQPKTLILDNPFPRLRDAMYKSMVLAEMRGAPAEERRVRYLQIFNDHLWDVNYYSKQEGLSEEQYAAAMAPIDEICGERLWEGN